MYFFVLGEAVKSKLHLQKVPYFARNQRSLIHKRALKRIEGKLTQHKKIESHEAEMLLKIPTPEI